MLQNSWIHNLWNKPFDTPMLGRSAFPIHGKAYKRQGCGISHIRWEQRKTSCLFHAQQLTEIFSSNFIQNLKSFLAFWAWHATRLPSELKSVLILRCSNCKVSVRSLPYDIVNQLEMKAISLQLNVCMTHQNLATQKFTS